MLLAIAALLIQVPAIPQDSIPIATPVAADLGASIAFTPSRIVQESVSPGIDLPTLRSLPLPAARGIVTPVYLAAAKPHYEPSLRLWFTLSIAQHGAATFDAWSTRRVISSGQGLERDPLLRPFAGNASLYGAIQVGPVLLDYLAHRMMKSQQGWARHAWWLPQALGTAAFIASAVHNVGLASVPHAGLP